MKNERPIPLDQIRELKKCEDERQLSMIVRQRFEIDKLIEKEEQVGTLMAVGERLHRAYVSALIMNHQTEAEHIGEQMTACMKKIQLLKNRSQGIVTPQ